MNAMIANNQERTEATNQVAMTNKKVMKGRRRQHMPGKHETK